jgi:PIN domain nuclease of toxin-antitoxin system
MKLLLDTHVVIWWWARPARLRADVRRAIATADVVVVSAASGWEAIVKQSLGKLSLPAPFSRMVAEASFGELPVRMAHVDRLSELPAHHRDPFDRMLIAQAIADRLTLVTHDPHFKPYGLDVLWT